MTVVASCMVPLGRTALPSQVALMWDLMVTNADSNLFNLDKDYTNRKMHQNQEHQIYFVQFSINYIINYGCFNM